MPQPWRILLMVLAVLTTTGVAFGADEQGAPPPPSPIIWLIIAAPAICLFLWFLLISRKSGVLRQGSYMAKGAEHIDLVNEHMIRMEQKSDRIIALLESIDRKLSDES